jgi:tetratricopeptide (TPR) repeat protein
VCTSKTAALLTIVLAAISMAIRTRGQDRSTRSPVDKTKVTEALVLLAQARQAAIPVKDSFHRGEILDRIGAAYATAGNVDAAVEIAADAYPNDMASLTAIGHALGDTNDIARAQAIRSKLKGGASTVFAFMAERQAETGNIGRALTLVEQIEAPEVRSDALNSIAETQAKAGDYAGARRTREKSKALASKQENPDDPEMSLIDEQIARGDLLTARTSIDSLSSPLARASELIYGAEELLERGDTSDAAAFLHEGLQKLPPDAAVFGRYMAIPIQVKLGEKEEAAKTASEFTGEMRIKGYAAIAVTAAEMKDLATMNSAIEQMQQAGKVPDRFGMGEFEAKMMILGVTSALIDHNGGEEALRLLDALQKNLNETDRVSVETDIQSQQAIVLAQQGKFEDAAALALKMRPDRVSDDNRGIAIRSIAILQAKKSGVVVAQKWAATLTELDDRASAFTAIAQVLLGIDDTTLPYSAIIVH